MYFVELKFVDGKIVDICNYVVAFLVNFKLQQGKQSKVSDLFLFCQH